MQPHRQPLVTRPGSDAAGEQSPFWQDLEAGAWFAADAGVTDAMAHLTHQVSRKPHDLPAHLRRIHFCYQHRQREALNGALLDLLLILDGKGMAIRRRLLDGCIAQIDPELAIALTDQDADPNRLPGHRYSVFSAGRLGTTQLVSLNRHHDRKADFLTLANDCIEYSQLEQAMEILEKGLLDDPARLDAQAVLLDLYRSTRRYDCFTHFYQKLTDRAATLLPEWQRLAESLKDKT